MKAQIFPESCYDFVPLSLKDIHDAHKKQRTITGFVEGILIDKQIVVVKLGDKLFGHLPFSEVTIYPLKYYADDYFSRVPVQVNILYQKTIRIKVTSTKGKAIMLSRKANMLEAYEYLKTCSSVRFDIQSLRTFSAFGDIGEGIAARLSIKDACNARIRNISEYFHVGDKAQVNIISHDDTKRFLVSYKSTFAQYNPADYYYGDVLTARVCEPMDDEITGYHLDISPNVCGIMDATPYMPLLAYGTRIECSVRKALDRGIRVCFLRCLDQD